MAEYLSPKSLNVYWSGGLPCTTMLEQGIIPGIRLGRRWIVTRNAYEEWERTCGMHSGTGLKATQEVMVLN